MDLFFFSDFISKLYLWSQALHLLLFHTTTHIPGFQQPLPLSQSSDDTGAVFKEAVILQTTGAVITVRFSPRSPSHEHVLIRRLINSCSYSDLRFITEVWEYAIGSYLGKRGRTQKRSCAGILFYSPAHCRVNKNASTCKWWVCSVKSLEILRLELFIEADHIGTPGLSCIEIPNRQKTSRCSVQATCV